MMFSAHAMVGASLCKFDDMSRWERLLSPLITQASLSSALTPLLSSSGGELRRARLRTEVRGQVHYVKSSNSKTPTMLVLLRLSLRSRIKHRHDSSLNDVPKSVDDHSP